MGFGVAGGVGTCASYRWRRARPAPFALEPQALQGATRRYKPQTLSSSCWARVTGGHMRRGLASKVHIQSALLCRYFSLSALDCPSATSILILLPGSACGLPVSLLPGSSSLRRYSCRTIASIRSHHLFPAFLAALRDRFWPPDDDPPPASSPAPSSLCQLARLSVSPLLSSRCRPPLILCRHGQCQQ